MRKELADTDLKKLSPSFRKKVEGFLSEVWDKVRVTEWFRSQERQNWLYGQWRNRWWNIVTWTKKSNHTSWVAIDICFKGIEPYPKDILEWKKIAIVAKKYQMEWWYDLWWRDMSHFQDNWKTLNIMWEYETLFMEWKSKWQTNLLNDVDWWIKKTWINRELAFSLLIMMERLNKKNTD